MKNLMILNRKGVTRIVFVFKTFVVKVPNFLVHHQHFLNGCYANWSERQLYKQFKTINDCEIKNLIIPSYFCSWFGLFQIQARAEELQRDLTKLEVEKFKDVCSNDIKKENFGIYKNTLVCLDYP